MYLLKLHFQFVKFVQVENSINLSKPDDILHF